MRAVSAAGVTGVGPWTPLRRFLISAPLWLTTLLLIWSFLLQPPMLDLLRASEQIVLRLAGAVSANPIREESAGDWTFKVPVNDSATAAGVKIRSIDFSMTRADVVLFTFSLPLFWAIMLAARIGRDALPSLVYGTIAVGAAEVLLLFLFLEVSAYGLLSQFHPPSSTAAKWLRDLLSYLIVSVFPFVLPMVAALLFHRGLRRDILPVFSGSQ